MLPSIRCLAIAEIVFAVLLLMVLSADVIPVFGRLLSTHSKVGVVGFSLWLLAVVSLLAVVVVGLPFAIRGLVKWPEQRKPLQLAVVAASAVLIVAIVGWLALSLD